MKERKERREIRDLFEKVFGPPPKEKIFFFRPPSPAKKIQ